MTIVGIIDIFNLIKPSFDEVKSKADSLPADILSEIHNEYDLKIVSMDMYDDLLIDILMNTNICRLSFSPFHLSNRFAFMDEYTIGSIEEKGNLFYNEIYGKVIFRKSYTQNLGEEIDQVDFIKFLLKYWELDFNRIYRKGSPCIYTSNITLNPNSFEAFPIAEELLLEIGKNLKDITA